MRRVKPIVRSFRYLLEAFPGIPLSRNWLFRRVLYLLRRMNCLLTCEGDVVQTTVTVPNTLVTIRGADTLAKHVYVFNSGANRAYIIENGVIIAICDPGEEIKLPVAGYLLLKAYTDSSTTTVRVLTYRRCLCGDEMPPYDSGFVNASGPNLI